jgi:hypothetical protein
MVAQHGDVAVACTLACYKCASIRVVLSNFLILQFFYFDPSCVHPCFVKWFHELL